MTDYAKGRADALKEAMKIAATYIDWTGPGWDGAAKHIHDDIEKLAQQPQPEPKRDCGTCRFKFGDGKCHNCIRERIFERLEYINWQPKEGAKLDEMRETLAQKEPSDG